MVQVSAVAAVAFAATSAPNDWTRFAWAGGGAAGEPAFGAAIVQVCARTALWSGLAVEVGVPRPPPI